MMEAMPVKVQQPWVSVWHVLGCCVQPSVDHVPLHMSRSQCACAAGYTELKILFDNPWLVAVTRWRLAGEAPHPRSGNTLSCFGKHQLHSVLCSECLLWMLLRDWKCGQPSMQRP